MKYVNVLLFLLLSTIVLNARVGTGLSINPSLIEECCAFYDVSTIGWDTDNARTDEIILKHDDDELSKRKKALVARAVKLNNKLRSLEAQHANIVGKNDELKKNILQARNRFQKSGVPELRKKRAQLEKKLESEENIKAQLELQLQNVENELNERNSRKETLGKIRDEVSSQLIMENKDYLDKPFSAMSLADLEQLLSKCQKYSSDSKINEFVSKIDNTIKIKRLYDDMVKTVNSPYKKADVDKALASIPNIKGINTVQSKEINELKIQLSSFSNGLAAFKEFITKLNEVRNGVNYYSMDYFQSDSKQILSKNNLGNRIENQLKRVPYLSKKFEEFMNAFKAAPNKHSDVETEILNQ